MDTLYDCRDVPGDGAPSKTPPRMDQLRAIDAGNGPHPPIWWVITPDGERCLCYVVTETECNNNSHAWVHMAWNNQGVRVPYSNEEWRTARLEGLVEPVHPEEPIQDLILDAIKEEIITPRCGLELYKETITDEEAVPAGGHDG